MEFNAVTTSTAIGQLQERLRTSPMNPNVLHGTCYPTLELARTACRNAVLAIDSARRFATPDAARYAQDLIDKANAALTDAETFVRKVEQMSFDERNALDARYAPPPKPVHGQKTPQGIEADRVAELYPDGILAAAEALGANLRVITREWPDKDELAIENPDVLTDQLRRDLRSHRGMVAGQLRKRLVGMQKA